MSDRLPETEEVDAAYEAQGRKRYLVMENPSIDDAYGVVDYDGEKWEKAPYVSESTARSLAEIRNRGAKRL